MKNMFNKLFIIACAFFFFQGSSPWEGAAAVAPDGEIPSVGRYIATNSFPPHSIVDIRNIENNRSTHAIVVKGLDNPGLLALVSDEVARIIGMRPGSVSRVRMIQPTDPMAYMRFMETMNTGVQEFIPENGLTEEQLLEELYRYDTYRPPVITQNTNSTNTPERGYVADEPEWGGNGRLNIVDVPVFDVDPVQYDEKTEPVTTVIVVPEPEPEPVYITEYIEEAEELEEEIIEVVELIEEEFEITDEYITEHEEEELEPEEYLAEHEEEEMEAEEYIAELEEEEEEEGTEIVELIEEEEFEITEIAESEEVEEEYIEIAEETEETIEEEIEEQVVVVQQPLVPVEAEERVVDVNFDIPHYDFISGIDSTAEESASPPVSVTTEQTLSLRTITQLIKGQYYVQLAALNYEQVEVSLSEINRRFTDFLKYNPAIFRDNDNLYKIVIGPLNQGESAAVLQRFRSIGYSDAFVRHVR
ncbi:MAG: SPOR domain-containing protein [Treponema sp.]|nr:SPOR domain-containing protein [Treponema sp.]